jgi:CIC family chloride channel protein
MAGGAIGTLVHQYAPFPTGDPGAYALVGMGTLFAGIIRAPMTSVFMIFELTQDYQIIVPLMVANLLALTISRRFQPVPVYHALLQQDHIHLPSAEARELSHTITAGDVMSSEAPHLPADQSIAAALTAIGGNPIDAALVGTADGVIGVVTADALRGAVQGGRGAEPVGAVAETLQVHVHPDHGLDVVFDRLMQSRGALPVVNRDHVRRVSGVVTLSRLMQALAARGNERRAGDTS